MKPFKEFIAEAKKDWARGRLLDPQGHGSWVPHLTQRSKEAHLDAARHHNDEKVSWQEAHDIHIERNNIQDANYAKSEIAFHEDRKAHHLGCARKFSD